MRQKEGEAVEDLAKHPLFTGVEEEVLEGVMDHAVGLDIAKGETIYEPKRFHRCLGVLLRGRVQVRREQLLVSVLEAGDVFGAAALFHPCPQYPTTLTALTPCTVLLIPQEQVRQLLHTSGAFAQHYVEYLSGRIHFLSRRLDTVSAGSSQVRLAQYLLTAREEDGTVTLSATQLCQRIAVGRATLYRAFEVLEGEGLITRDGKTIHIPDPQRLSVYATLESGKEESK